ncbi:MAG: thioredoxin-dependent thiol peroxidase [Alphaproteobacteria bacterium CG11_big_fil_rev_8_21_14_0_20_44_7]|nr:MAG: thioredoxin-dependent thiol peroxidase [Alphaproteobacteria bacterium CG11_big_fil_rev_8_21_14_0_20_44_7]
MATNTTLKEGVSAPDFNLPSDGNGKISLKALRGKNVVLYFYPKDDTPGCTIEAKDFRDLNEEFAKANTVIIGISKDSVKSHDKFKDKYCLSFPLASDEDGSICDKYGVWTEKSMFGKKYMGIQRATFLIDSQGKIAKIWPKVSVSGHAAEVLGEAKSL